MVWQLNSRNAAECRWVVESGKLMYPDTFRHVSNFAFTWATDKMSSSFPNRGNSVCPRCAVGGEISDNNLEQRMNIEFCVKIGNSVSETFAPLTLACGEYAMKKMECFWVPQAVQGRARRFARWPEKWAAQKTQRTGANADRASSTHFC
jgi:hypothetical protein